MAKQSNTDLAPGETAPDFELTDVVSGMPVTRRDFDGSPLLVAFICNHCPYVVHLAGSFSALARALDEKGIRCVAISANDITTHPQDGPEKMQAFAEAHAFALPYLYDETQAVARAYGAVCTPEFYLFDDAHRLYYHGQYDSTRPKSGDVASGEDLRAAAEALLAGEPPPADQKPAVGCGIKWKADH